MLDTNTPITEIRIDLGRVFDRACRQTLEIVGAMPEATPDAALSADEAPWAREQLRKARDRVALLLERISKTIDDCPQAEQNDEELIFRVVCRTPVQEGLLPGAVERFMVSWVAAAWFRLRPELNASIDMERETDELNRLTLMSGSAQRPSYCF